MDHMITFFVFQSECIEQEGGQIDEAIHIIIRIGDGEAGHGPNEMNERMYAMMTNIRSSTTYTFLTRPSAEGIPDQGIDL